MEKTRLYYSIGQSIVEYAVVLGVVSVALIGMQIYMKRGIQAAIKVSADQLGPQQITINSKKHVSTVSTVDKSDSSTLTLQDELGGSQRRDFDATTNSSSITTSVVEELQ